ncbi:MAG: Ribosomal large subunit pseudouridine synthase D [Candidatus Omnitrophica bacterium]|nr:Ribosomal large subunit pseudouridine synthase D [Candidatus Omnitrophota bacterium]
MPETFELTVGPLYQPKRIDAYLASALEERYGRKRLKEALDAGQVYLNDRPAKPSSLVKTGDRIRGQAVTVLPSTLQPENIPVSIVYEDKDLLVVDKPAGMVVHPGAGNKSGTLVNALLGRGTALSASAGADRPGIVHRLDKDTSGVLLVAKNDRALRRLQAQFQARSLSKTYLALVKGRVEYEEGRVELPIGPDGKQRGRMRVARDGKGREAETRYRVVRRYPHATLIEASPVTGRTHQIRVHMAHLGHPVVGDEIYGTRTGNQRLGLHAARIRFEHPTSGKTLTLESAPPPEFAELLKEAEKSR